MGMVSYCASRRVSYNNTVITLYWICDMKKILMMFIIVFMFLFLPFIWAEHSKDLDGYDKVPDDEWPSQVIFDTIHVCYNGTLRWVAMGNPSLLNTPPPYGIARLMTVHCFCVLDKVRTQYKYRAYVDHITKDDRSAPTLIPKLFMGKSVECIRDYHTLQGLILLDEESLKALNEFTGDNETQGDKSEDILSDNNSGKSDSPEQPEELPREDVPLLNF